MTSWSPLTWIVLALGLIAVPVALLLPEESAAPAAVVERRALAVEALPAVDTASPTEPQPDEPARLAPFEALTETTARPLFAATRRPPPPEPIAVDSSLAAVEMPAEPPPPALERTDFVLIGIVQRSDGSFVMLKPRAGGAVVTAREGDDAGGWHVAAIGPTAVRLTSPAGDAEHVLFAPRPAADPAATGQVGAVPYQ